MHGDNVFQTKRLRRARRQEQNRAQTGFFDLPAELRLEIHQLVLQSELPAAKKLLPIAWGAPLAPVPQLTITRASTLCTSILRTCRLIFREAAPVLYEAFEWEAVLPVQRKSALSPSYWPKFRFFRVMETSIAIAHLPSYGLQSLRKLVFTGDNVGSGDFNTVLGHANTAEGCRLGEAVWQDLHEQAPNIKHVRILFNLALPLQPNFRASFVGGIARGKKVEDVAIEVSPDIQLKG